jgi:hypothetical protein
MPDKRNKRIQSDQEKMKRSAMKKSQEFFGLALRNRADPV